MLKKYHFILIPRSGAEPSSYASTHSKKSYNMFYPHEQMIESKNDHTFYFKDSSGAVSMPIDFAASCHLNQMSISQLRKSKFYD